MQREAEEDRDPQTQVSMDDRPSCPMTNDERKGIERVHATLSTLTPATPRDDAIAFDLRYAARLMTAAMGQTRCKRGGSERLARRCTESAQRGRRLTRQTNAYARHDREGAAGRRVVARSASCGRLTPLGL